MTNKLNTSPPTKDEIKRAAGVLLNYVDANESSTTNEGLEDNLLQENVSDDIVTAADVKKIVDTVRKQ